MSEVTTEAVVATEKQYTGKDSYIRYAKARVEEEFGVLLSLPVVKQVYNAILEKAMQELSEGKKVRLGDLGIICTRTFKGGRKRNPRTGETFDVPDRKVARLNPSKKLKDTCKALTV